MDDDNRALLRQILGRSWLLLGPADPAQKKIGDYYSACMDEKAIEAAGAAPLKASLDRINGMRSKRDIAGHAQPVNLVRLRIRRGFQGLHPGDRGKWIRTGSAFPIADYYVKTDAKLVELRQAYLADVQKMFGRRRFARRLPQAKRKP